MNPPPFTFARGDDTAAARTEIFVICRFGRGKIIPGNAVLRVANDAPTERALWADDLLAFPRDHHDGGCDRADRQIFMARERNNLSFWTSILMPGSLFMFLESGFAVQRAIHVQDPRGG